MGSIMNSFFPGQPIWTMLVAALVMAMAGGAMLRVEAAKYPRRVFNS
jgi:maltose/moltooligosaccharide transporter